MSSTDSTTEEATAPARKGPEVIAGFVRRLPKGPGVYRMLNDEGEVLYVGKARNLKARVSNYARFGGQSNRIARMIAETANMEFVSTRTETEALLLEANLIKRLRPRFNVLMRDDKSFPYILITRDHEAPQIVKHRGARNRKGDYFGPFASAGAVNRTLNALERAFLLRSCTDSVYESRTRPCLLYQIKRCSAPCTGEIALEDYARLVEEAEGFLSGKSGAVRQDLAKLMEDASQAMEFERAAVYRDRLSALSHVQGHQGINPRGVEEADVFAVHQEGGQSCVQVFFFRTGQNWGNRAYFPKADKSFGPEEVLESFVAQFYDDKQPPRLVLLSHDLEEEELMAEALATRAGRKVEVATPKRGEKRELVEHALSNAKEALGRRLAESASQGRLLDGLAETLGLDGRPERIEVYDNSHIMGTNPVGAMIVMGEEGFAKGQYRKFNIKSAIADPRRRLRDDARGADAPLLAAPEGARGGDEGRRRAGARPRGHRRRAGPARRRARGHGGARRRRHRRHLGRQGPRPRRRPRDVPHAGPRAVQAAAARSRCSTSSSACATRRTASPSARTGRGARRRWARTRSTRSPASGRRASGRCCTISDRPRR